MPLSQIEADQVAAAADGERRREVISQAEAKMEAAAIVLRYTAGIPRCPTITPEVDAEIDAIEIWLRRRAVGGDKILLRQIEKPLGRQVKPTGRAARAIEAAAKARGKPS